MALGCLGKVINTDISSSSGKMPVEYMLLYKSVSLSTPKSLRAFSISVVIPSSPGALPSWEFFNAF